MKSRILLLIVALLMFGITVNSQTSGISFGLRGGFDMQNINGRDIDDDQLTMDLVPRFNAGLVVDIPLGTDMFFQPGLFFTTKGAKSDAFFGLGSVEYNLSYIELPLSLLYKPMLGNGRFFLGFGPYLSYGIMGKTEYTVGNLTTEENIEFTSERSGLFAWKYFKPFDYGGNLFFGYELASGILLQLNTQLGMANIYPDPDSDIVFKNTGFGLSLGYNF